MGDVPRAQTPLTPPSPFRPSPPASAGRVPVCTWASCLPPHPLAVPYSRPVDDPHALQASANAAHAARRCASKLKEAQFGAEPDFGWLVVSVHSPADRSHILQLLANVVQGKTPGPRSPELKNVKRFNHYRLLSTCN